MKKVKAIIKKQEEIGIIHRVEEIKIMIHYINAITANILPEFRFYSWKVMKLTVFATIW